MTVKLESGGGSEDPCPLSWNSVYWSPLVGLSRRIGSRFGFAPVALSNMDVALIGGAVHYENGSSGPVPLSQIHCVSAFSKREESASFGDVSLVEIRSGSPVARLYHSATFVGHGTVIVFGGQSWTSAALDRQKLSDVWALKFDGLFEGSNESRYCGQWTELAPVAASRSNSFPPTRSHHAAVAIGTTGSFIVSGGLGFEDSVLGDMWVASVVVVSGGATVVQWKKVNSPIGRHPVARHSHALSALVSDIELLLHGGVDSAGNILSDLWIAQFTNEEKTRCVWSELVSSPSPRKGHIMLTMNRENSPCVMVFGGQKHSAERYCLGSGKWSCSANESYVGGETSLLASPVSCAFFDKNDAYSIPSVLMIPDNAVAAEGVAAWVASVFAVDLVSPNGDDQLAIVTKEEEGSEEDKITDKNEVIFNYLNSPEQVAQRRTAYNNLFAQLPFLKPPPDHDSASKAVAVSDRKKLSFEIPQNGQFGLQYFASNLFEETAGDNLLVQAWPVIGQSSLSHVLVKANSQFLALSSVEQVKSFANDPSTLKAVTEMASSVLIVCKLAGGDIISAFVSEALIRQSGSNSCDFPVFSLNESSYTDVQATLRLLTVYTPFKTPAQIDQLFKLFNENESGFVLIDADVDTDQNGAVVHSISWTNV